MRIISQKRLSEAKKKHPDAAVAIQVWLSKTKMAQWDKPSEILQDFSKARPISNSRVIFNLCKNAYRLVVAIHHNRKTVYIRFFGSHSEYDKIDPITI